MDKFALARELARDEGKRDTMYYDSVGVPTIGIGHNLTQPIPEGAIQLIFEHDMARHLEEAETLSYWHSLSAVRQRVIANMLFNLGMPTFKEFKNLNKALAAQDYEQAAIEMTDSKWYRQVKSRAERLVRAMRSNNGDDLR